jgi:chromosomal replication initiator protein
MAGSRRPSKIAAVQGDAPWLPLEENRFAATALSRLQSKKSSPVPQSVYLYGPAGVGKTLLLRTFLKEILTEDPSLHCVNLTATTLVENIHRAIDHSTMDELREDYTHCDYFLCEDLHGIRRHRRAQDFLTAILDEILATGGRVIFTALTTPSDLGSLLPRLRNRCHACTTAQLTQPGFPSRIKIIAHYAQHRQFAISEEAIHILAKGLPGSPRELIAAVHQLEMRSRVKSQSLTDIDLVRQFLAGEEPARRVSVSEITRIVAKHFVFSVAKLRASSRQRTQVTARQCAMFLSRKLSGKPFTYIAKYFGKKNHSTVVYACQQISSKLQTDSILRNDLKTICTRLGISPQSIVEKPLTN